MSVLLTLCMVLSPFPTRAMAAKSTLCCAEQYEFCYEGQPLSEAQVYNVKGTNNLKPHPIAAMLSGTISQFNKR